MSSFKKQNGELKILAPRRENHCELAGVGLNLIFEPHPTSSPHQTGFAALLASSDNQLRMIACAPARASSTLTCFTSPIPFRTGSECVFSTLAVLGSSFSGPSFR